MPGGVCIRCLAVEALNDAGYLPRKTMQFHFHNQHPERPGQKYTSFDDYLNIFKSKRRSKVRHTGRLQAPHWPSP